jgi:hypothetical protein
MSFLGGARSADETDGNLSLPGKGLQQAYDVARERHAGSRRWRGCRKLHRLSVIDAIRNGVIPRPREKTGPATTSSVRPARQRIESCIGEPFESPRENAVAVTIGV